MNDLDLTLEMGGWTYYPNGRTSPDRDNNAERVVVSAQDGDEAIITVTGYNLMQRSQQYSLVATGCFGGVANTNFLDSCSAFECDESANKRRNNILMAIFIPLGVILICCCGMALRRRSKRGGGGASDDRYDNDM